MVRAFVKPKEDENAGLVFNSLFLESALGNNDQSRDLSPRCFRSRDGSDCEI